MGFISYAGMYSHASFLDLLSRSCTFYLIVSFFLYFCSLLWSIYSFLHILKFSNSFRLAQPSKWERLKPWTPLKSRSKTLENWQGRMNRWEQATMLKGRTERWVQHPSPVFFLWCLVTCKPEMKKPLRWAKFLSILLGWGIMIFGNYQGAGFVTHIKCSLRSLKGFTPVLAIKCI